MKASQKRIFQGYALLSERLSQPPYSLESLQEAYAYVGHPLKDTPTFLVAGTNGKGLTAACLYGIWQNLGCKVGLFSSPHIFHMRERCQISSASQHRDALALSAYKLSCTLPLSLSLRLSSFEFLVLSACEVMQGCGVEIAVMEVGLGGRCDGTNILDPDVSMITSIDLDHQHILGPTLRDIAREKAGICRKNRPWVLYRDGAVATKEREMLNAFWHRHAKEYPLVVWLEEPTHLSLPSWLYSGDPRKVPVYLRKAYHMALKASEHLLPYTSNLGGVYEAITAKTYEDLRVQSQASPQSLAVTLRGRGEVFEYKEHRVYVDVAHNPAALRASLEAYRDFTEDHKESVGLFSLLEDKDIYGILDVISTTFSEVILCADHHQPRGYHSSGGAGDPLWEWKNQNPDKGAVIGEKVLSWQEGWSLFHQRLSCRNLSVGYVGGSFYAAQKALSYQGDVG